MNLHVKTPQEIEAIRASGQILKKALALVAANVKPGISTWELNQIAEDEIARLGGSPAFKGYGDSSNPYPAALCTSVNDVVVHGIPSQKEILKPGDIITLDLGVEYKGMFSDSAITVPVGEISVEAQELLQVTKQALEASIQAAVVGNTTGDIGYACQLVVESAGLSVVQDLVGHGVGFAVHEDPQVPGYGRPGKGIRLVPGMVLAIEPMVTLGDYKLVYDSDGWTISTRDGSLAAHFEHTVAITKDGPKILT